MKNYDHFARLIFRKSKLLKRNTSLNLRKKRHDAIKRNSLICKNYWISSEEKPARWLEKRKIILIFIKVKNVMYVHDTQGDVLEYFVMHKVASNKTSLMWLSACNYRRFQLGRFFSASNQLRNLDFKLKARD